MVFRFKLPVQVERPTGELSKSATIDVELIYQGAKWRAQCQDPPIATLMHDSMEEALVSAVKEMERDWARNAPPAEAETWL